MESFRETVYLCEEEKTLLEYSLNHAGKVVVNVL